jgi:hypothetical protein
MSGFVVDSRTLVAVRDTLGRLHDQLAGMHSDVWQQWGTLGGRALESELEHFCGTWHYGVTELGGQLHDLTRRLGEAAAAYERIEQRITHAAGGSSATSTTGSAGAKGSTHPTTTHHGPTKHSTTHHTAPKHSNAKHHSASTGTSYSGGAGLTGTTNHGSRSGGGTRSTHQGREHDGGKKHSGSGSGVTVIGGSSGHSGTGTHHGNSGSGSGTTIIGGGAGTGGGGSHGAGDAQHPKGGDKHPGSGSGVTVIGGGSSKGGGSGTTTIDEKIHHAESRQRAELAAILKTVDK